MRSSIVEPNFWGGSSLSRSLFSLMVVAFVIFGGTVAAAICEPGGMSPSKHPYHVSVAEVEWNSKTKKLEVALCVWPADLEKSLAKLKGKPVDLDKTRKLDGWMKKLVSKKFTFRNTKGEAKALSWVGHEKDLKQAWLYFEVDGVQVGETLTISNQIFFDLNEEQQNQLNGKIGKQRLRTAFIKGKAEQSFKITSD